MTSPTQISTPIDYPEEVAMPHPDTLATRDQAIARAERIRAGIKSLSELQQDLADAYHARDWATLGYDSWDGYVNGEFGGSIPRLDRGERRELVVNLRAEGLSTRAIASASGQSEGSVRNDLRAGAQNYAPAPLPEQSPVVGIDGKTYAPSKPAPRPKPDEDEPTTAVPRQTERRQRTDVVRVISQVITYAEEAAEHAEHIRKEHLTTRREEATVWGRRLSQALETLQQLNSALQEASS